MPVEKIRFGGRKVTAVVIEELAALQAAAGLTSETAALELMARAVRALREADIVSPDLISTLAHLLPPDQRCKGGSGPTRRAEGRARKKGLKRA